MRKNLYVGGRKYFGDWSPFGIWKVCVELCHKMAAVEDFTLPRRAMMMMTVAKFKMSTDQKVPYHPFVDATDK